MPISLLQSATQFITHKIKQHFSVKPLSESQANIQEWFDSPYGQQLLSAEQKALDQIMPEIYGYHLMQLSVLNRIKLSKQSPVTHHFSIGIKENSGNPAIANFEQLPIEAESIDAALLHHALEYSTNPHQLLRETARTIIPNGYIIIVGFNSATGLNVKKNLNRAFTKKQHWRYHSLGHRRLEDWLRILDFEPVFFEYGFHTLPFSQSYHPGYDAFANRLLPFTGNFYVIAARKSVIPMTLIKNPWNRSTAFPNWAKGSAVPREPAIHRNGLSSHSLKTKFLKDKNNEKR